MGKYTKECLEYFIAHQSQLFDEAVAYTAEEAEEFLEDCMAEVLDSPAEVAEYLEEYGMDTTNVSPKELLNEAEVFTLPNGRYLIVMA